MSILLRGMGDNTMTTTEEVVEIIIGVDVECESLAVDVEIDEASLLVEVDTPALEIEMEDYGRDND